MKESIKEMPRTTPLFVAFIAFSTLFYELSLIRVLPFIGIPVYGVLLLLLREPLLDFFSSGPLPSVYLPLWPLSFPLVFFLACPLR